VGAKIVPKFRDVIYGRALTNKEGFISEFRDENNTESSNEAMNESPGGSEVQADLVRIGVGDRILAYAIVSLCGNLNRFKGNGRSIVLIFF
jgi:hypothetical protein